MTRHPTDYDNATKIALCLDRLRMGDDGDSYRAVAEEAKRAIDETLAVRGLN